MAQIIAKHCYDIGWGGTAGYMSLMNGGGFAGYFTDGPNSTRVPVSCGGTFSNLSVLADAAGNPTCTFTLAVNGVATALSVTLPAGATTAGTDTTHTVAVNAGDDVSLLITGANDGSVSGDAGFSVLFTPSDPTLSTYGLTAETANTGVSFGGALGNGVWQTNTGTQSNTYSIACVAGAITRIDLKSMRGTFGGGNTFTCYVKLNGVVQDGTGGTVNTAVVLDGASTSAAGSFNLPIVPGDLVDLYMVYAGAGLTFALNVAASCLFQATEANVFHWCGGNNDALDPVSSTYHWPIAKQNSNTSEATAQTTVGPVGFTATALYVRHVGSSFTASASFTDTLRVNGVSTSQTVTVPQTATTITGLSSTAVAIPAGALVDVQVTPGNSPDGMQFHWGVAMRGPTASLTVTKQTTSTDPDAQSQSFNFTATGGLTPATFSLTPGQSQVFTGVTPGTYGISEDTPLPPGWDTVTYDVSTGDPHTAIVLAGDTQVTVTAINAPCVTQPTEAACWGDDSLPPSIGCVSEDQTQQAGTWSTPYDNSVQEIGLVNPEGSH